MTTRKGLRGQRARRLSAAEAAARLIRNDPNMLECNLELALFDVQQMAA